MSRRDPGATFMIEAIDGLISLGHFIRKMLSSRAFISFLGILIVTQALGVVEQTKASLGMLLR